MSIETNRSILEQSNNEARSPTNSSGEMGHLQGSYEGTVPNRGMHLLFGTGGRKA